MSIEWEYVLILSRMLHSVGVILPFIVTVTRIVMDLMDSHPFTCILLDGNCIQSWNK